MTKTKFFGLIALLVSGLATLFGPTCQPPADTTPPEFAGISAIYPCNESVTLTWAAARDASAPVTYRVYRSETSGVYDWNAPLLQTSALEASIDSLINGTSYFFVVRAVDAVGNSEANTREESVKPQLTYPELPYRELIFDVDPQKFPSSHSSCIVELPGGELFTVWYCGTSEHTDDVALWGSRRQPGATAWSYPEIIQDTPEFPDGNSVLYLGSDQKLWLIWALQTRFEWPSATLMAKTSLDFGKTWGTPYEFGVPPGYLPRTHPLTLSNGWILVPLYIEWSASAVVAISKDNGAHWEVRVDYVLPFLGIQPTVIQRADDSLFAMTRTGAPPQQSWQAVSNNYGETWVQRRLSDIPNPGSSLEMVHLADNDVVLAFNNSKTDRSNLSLALSRDEGDSWPVIKTVDENPQSSASYPSIIQDKCGLIHVTYSYDDRRSIAHFVTDKSWIEE